VVRPDVLCRASVRLEYSSALRTLLTAPLRKFEEEGIPQTLSLMQVCISERRARSMCYLSSL